MKRFEDRTRFNWGYHDGAHDFELGGILAKREGGEFLKYHHDKVWVEGFWAGYTDAKHKRYFQNSDEAWLNRHAFKEVK